MIEDISIKTLSDDIIKYIHFQNGNKKLQLNNLFVKIKKLFEENKKVINIDDDKSYGSVNNLEISNFDEDFLSNEQLGLK